MDPLLPDRVFNAVGEFLFAMSLVGEEGIFTNTTYVGYDVRCVFVVERLPCRVDVTVHVLSNEGALLDATMSVLRWEGVSSAAERGKWTTAVVAPPQEIDNRVQVCISFTKRGGGGAVSD